MNLFINRFKNKKVAIGNFDLIHKGHELVFKNADLILTFKHIPKKMNSVYDFKERKRFFKSINKQILIYDLAKPKNNISAIDFYNKYLKDAKTIYVGSNFIFGKDQIKVTDFINQYNINNIQLIDILDNYSSSLIKQYLKQGEINQANQLLLEPFHIKSKVEIGNKIGRSIGYRTINFYFDNSNQLIIPTGVYISKTKFKNKLYKSVSFYGKPQSVQDNKSIRLETHIIGLNKNLYFKKVTVYLYKRIADIKKFNSVDELKEAISSYIDMSISYD